MSGDGMLPAERDRLVALEVKQAELALQLAEIDKKLDQLIKAALMGKGAWWLILRIGGSLVGLALLWSAFGQGIVHVLWHTK